MHAGSDRSSFDFIPDSDLETARFSVSQPKTGNSQTARLYNEKGGLMPPLLKSFQLQFSPCQGNRLTDAEKS